MKQKATFYICLLVKNVLTIFLHIFTMGYVNRNHASPCSCTQVEIQGFVFFSGGCTRVSQLKQGAKCNFTLRNIELWTQCHSGVDKHSQGVCKQSKQSTVVIQSRIQRRCGMFHSSASLKQRQMVMPRWLTWWKAEGTARGVVINIKSWLLINRINNDELTQATCKLLFWSNRNKMHEENKTRGAA